MNKVLKVFHKGEILSTGLIILYIIFTLVYQQYMFNEVLKTNLITMFLGFLIVFNYITSANFNLKNFRINKTTILAIVLIIFVLINSFLIRHEILVGAIFSIIITGVIGKKINEFKSEPWLLLFPFWFLVFYIFMRLQINPSPSEIFLNSRNYVSFYLIITVLPYYYVSLKNKKKYNSIPAFVTVFLCLYALGRSGIVASILILLAILLPRFNKKDRIKLFVSIILLLILFVSLSDFFLEEMSELNKFENVDNFLNDDGRSSIVSLYFQKMDFYSFLFGMDTVNQLSQVLATYSHVHSSLLAFHSTVGIASLLFFYHLYKKSKVFIKENLPLLFLLLALTIRASTDVGMLFAFFDYVFWMFLFYPFEIKKIKKIKKIK
ncbi:hypothetical protein [Polaribacter sp. KT 15]|uniref:hypothetical protein n=1 Tax=Polaribacter sp. KT 15 TaxID=1896175 RepID=UPI00090A8C26|nr:hypothetical protein [Polaribacter sp. KT 15]SHN00936.1 hypothetical protein SAMN05720268_2051 [Polaribacter sp. KT 15]